MGLYQNRLVVKVGTSTLMNELGKPDLRSAELLVRALADIHNRGYEVILVSSGAIAFGAGRLNLKQRPDSMRLKQAAAAVGQCRMLGLYSRLFGEYDTEVAQILLSEDDVTQQRQRDNLQQTFDTLLQLGTVPIVNENDSVNSTEIESQDHLFGDNDMLSAQVAVLCHASKLILLTDVDGLYDRDPKLDPAARQIPLVEEISESTFSLLGTRASRRGADGMKTKLRAADHAVSNGIDVWMIRGQTPAQLYDILRGEPAGTKFAAKAAF